MKCVRCLVIESGFKLGSRVTADVWYDVWLGIFPLFRKHVDAIELGTQEPDQAGAVMKPVKLRIVASSRPVSGIDRYYTSLVWNRIWNGVRTPVARTALHDRHWMALATLEQELS